MKHQSTSDRGRQPVASRPAPTVAALIRRVAQTFERAGLHYGHGTDNAHDEAASLVFHAADIAHGEAPAAYDWPVGDKARARLAGLVRLRIEERIPAPYLTGRTWFAGHEIRVDRRALIPRSPLAEFIRDRGAPFLVAGRVERILDLGTGSGCIAIAAAHAFRRARVDATDVSRDALDLAAENVRRHRLGKRLALVQADVFEGLPAGRYDLILANPPYVPAATVRRLPDEYRHEPASGLAAGRDGLSVVRRILAGAARRLANGGLLVVEVGDSERAVARAFPTVPFLWLEFEHGGGGLFLLDQRTVARHAKAFAESAAAKGTSAGAAVTRPRPKTKTKAKAKAKAKRKGKAKPGTPAPSRRVAAATTRGPSRVR